MDMEYWEQLAEYNGTTDGWTASEVDLSSYAGQCVFVGFQVDTDYSVTREGWFIDDIALTDKSSGSSGTSRKKSIKKTELEVVDKGSAHMKKTVNAKKLLPGEVIAVKAPVIESPADGAYTNEEYITEEGSAAPTITVTVYNYGEEAGTTEAKDDGSFAVDITLGTGENALTAVFSTDNGSTASSRQQIWQETVSMRQSLWMPNLKLQNCL